MPMFESIAIIISAVITVFGMVAIQFFNNQKRKDDFQDRLVFEAFQRRFAVYEDVLRTLSRMTTDEELPRIFSAKELFAKISDHIHTLDTLIARITLAGSSVSIKILYTIRLEMANILAENFDYEDVTFPSYVREVLIEALKAALSQFTESARKEAPIEIVDHFIFKSREGV
ncbi:MAG: hypothetical protein LBG57_09390 [Treponema sp.]|jgi:hypothetical protein|nr:hypothetical protein [Treponema sp.]